MRNRLRQLSGPFLLFVFVVLLSAAARAQYTETVLYSFCPGGGGCSDGVQPNAGLIADAQGNLYGSTFYGGAYNNGTIFELSQPGAGSGPWTYTVLYSFCAQSNCSDGAESYGGLIFDSKGNLYGTTSYGGASGSGTVFELSPPAAGSGAWTYAVLYAFTGGQDGGDPFAPVIFDAAQKNLYGTTSNFNLPAGGTVFELSPPSGGAGPWTETTLHTFQTNIDGNQPEAGLTFDSQGNLYGTTSTGKDSAQGGVVFELSPPNDGSGPWTETILFTPAQVSVAPQGFNASLIFDARGNLYSASGSGGSICCGDVFELSSAGSGAPWNVTNIYGFGSFTPTGSYPDAGLIFDSQGNLYGTTSEGGNTPACTTPGDFGLGCGVVYAVSPPSSAGSWTENLLYTFSNTDGEGPLGSLIADAHGNLYGTTSRGGASGQGVVYELSPIATGTTVVSSENPSTYGQGVYFTATVTPSNATGSVQFQIDGNNFGSPVPLSGGQASSLTIATLAATGHAIGALYSGTLYYGASAGSLVQTVNDAGASVGVTLTTGSNPSTYGSSLTFTATLTGQYGQVTKRRKEAHPQIVTGSVTWSANTGCSATPITAGTATCTTAVLPGGSDTVTATYGGDSDHNGNNGSVGQTVNPQTPVVTVTNVNPASESYGIGTPVAVTATLTWNGSGNVPGGTVSFSSNAGGSFPGSPSCSVINSTATCTQTFNPATTDTVGTYTISASYASDGNYNSAGSTQTNNFSIVGSKVTPAVNMTVVFPNAEPYGASLGAAITATLSWTGAGPAPTVAGAALLSFTSSAPGSFEPVVCLGKTSPIVCGTLFLPVVNDGVGAYTIRASYAGNSNYNAASSPQTNNFTITADMPAVRITPNPVTVAHGSAAPVVLTAAFTGAGSSDAAPTGTVTFSAATGTLSGQSCVSSKDVLTCTVSYKPSGTLAAGTYNNYLTASIVATGDYKAASGYANLTVTK